MPSLLILEDDRARASGYAGVLTQIGSGWAMRTWSDPSAMLDELDARLPGAGLIALEASLAAPLVARLAARAPACPVTLHWKTSTHDAAWTLFRQLRAAGWNADLVYRFREHWEPWHEQVWLPEAQRLVHWSGDTAKSRAHAANCELLRRQFEGREAIYVEKFVRRVRVSHIRAHVDSRHVEAYAEELLTPGLGVPPRYSLNSKRWRFGGGAETQFSADTWSLAVQHVSWQLCFAPAVIGEVVRFAGTLPAEEVYSSPRLHELVWKLTAEKRRAEKPVFP